MTKDGKEFASRAQGLPATVGDAQQVAHDPARRVSFGEAFRFWVKLGFISFGGPAGQIAIMHRELVERRRWLSEERFLHALNYCMLLPGPEAQQLAIYIGWLMHRTAGGLVAGAFFVIPSVFILLALSYVYAKYGQLNTVAGVLAGFKPVVVAIVVEALLKIGGRALKRRVHFLIAGAAFIAIFFLHVPFPVIVFAAGLCGLAGARLWPQAFLAANTKTANAATADNTTTADRRSAEQETRGETRQVDLSPGATQPAAAQPDAAQPDAAQPAAAQPDAALSIAALPVAAQPAPFVIEDDAPPPTHTLPSKSRALKILSVGVVLWVLPFAAISVWGGRGSLHADEYLFFTQAALVTFGGAYAVLAYVTQAAVGSYGWLSHAQAVDGLALAETTPGPLIMVLQFVGFMAAWNHPPDGLGQTTSAIAGALITTYTTFLPCFIFIFLGAPYIERLRGNKNLTGALSGITAAVVGVILNLALVFGAAVIWPQGLAGETNWFAAGLSVAAFVALYRFKLDVLLVVLAGGALGFLHNLFFA
ncbi:MAG TPA: chromate transporter [Pyrinomonadaceae bacterium]|nr:chromate transporter [Pyrinomonadaceae bacterium]